MRTVLLYTGCPNPCASRAGLGEHFPEPQARSLKPVTTRKWAAFLVVWCVAAHESQKKKKEGRRRTKEETKK